MLHSTGRVGPFLCIISLVLMSAINARAGVPQHFATIYGSLGAGSAGRTVGLGLSFIGPFRQRTGRPLGRYLGAEVLGYLSADESRRGKPDLTTLLSLGTGLYTPKVVIAPHISLGFTYDFWDAWGLGGDFCEGLWESSAAGCKRDARGAFGAGVDFLFDPHLVVGISVASDAGWAIHVGGHTGR